MLFSILVIFSEMDKPFSIFFLDISQIVCVIVSIVLFVSFSFSFVSVLNVSKSSMIVSVFSSERFSKLTSSLETHSIFVPTTFEKSSNSFFSSSLPLPICSITSHLSISILPLCSSISDSSFLILLPLFM